jgi:hypothetical protein
LPSKSEYDEWAFHMSGHSKTGLSVPGKSNPTAQDLLDYFEDPFWEKGKDLDENWDFTPQLVLASSYGILQAMYDTALTRLVVAGLEVKRSVNNPNEKPQDAFPITDLFDPEISIKIGANYLKIQYDANGGNWRTALKIYNGGSESYANAVMTKWNNGNGIFKEIIE